MRNQLIIFFIPSKTIKNELLPDTLPKFGTKSDCKFAGIYSTGIDYFISGHPLPDILLISDAQVNDHMKSILSQLNGNFHSVYAAFHESSKHIKNQQAAIFKYFESKNVITEEYTRSDNNDLYVTFTKVLEIFESDEYEAGKYQNAISGLFQIFDIDPVLEEKLSLAHSLLTPLNKNDFQLFEHKWEKLERIIQERTKSETISEALKTAIRKFINSLPVKHQTNPLAEAYSSQNSPFSKFIKELFA